MVILGVDPGTAITGYGVVQQENNKFKVLGYGAIRTDSKEDKARRLESIYDGLQKIIQEYQPHFLAIEEIFFNKNAATALAVGQARGVAMLAGAHAKIPVFEYTPLQVKIAVTGYGRATKAQVGYMVKTLLGLAEIPRPDDVADALAICLCHGFNSHNWGGQA